MWFHCLHLWQLARNSGALALALLLGGLLQSGQINASRSKSFSREMAEIVSGTGLLSTIRSFAGLYSIGGGSEEKYVVLTS